MKLQRNDTEEQTLKSVIKAADLTAAVMAELESYSKEIAEQVDIDVTEVSEIAAERLKETSPKNKGDYAKGWGVTVTGSKPGNKRVIVHNKKHYRLTHLLEKGHANRGGKGRTQAQPHIAPVEDWVVSELPKRIVEDIGK